MSPLSWTFVPAPTPSHSSRLSQSPGLSSLSHTANSHWLSILHMVIYMFPCYFLYLSHSLLLQSPSPRWDFCSFLIVSELFQILKDDAVKVLYSICQQTWKTQQWPQDWKRSVFISIPKKGNAKECSTCHTIALISHASKVMLKILQARLQQYVIGELPDVQAGFRKGRGTRDQIANICWVMEKAREFQEKMSIPALC